MFLIVLHNVETVESKSLVPASKSCIALIKASPNEVPNTERGEKAVQQTLPSSLTSWLYCSINGYK